MASIRGGPSRVELRAAAGKTVPDVLAADLDVLFCGINPSLYTAAVGHHFARPGNRFWPALHLGGFTPRLLSPAEESELLSLGCGITNIVARATATAAELDAIEFRAGGEHLRQTAERFRPRVVAVLGVTAYRLAFARRQARLGLQEESLGPSRLWLLPNPSGLNAHFQLPQLAAMFRDLRAFAVRGQSPDLSSTNR